MKFVALFLVAYLGFAAALNAVTFSNQNVTVANNGNGEFNFRFTSFGGFGLLGFNGVNYASLAGSGGNGQVNVDGIFGAAYTKLLIPPFAYLSFFDIAAKFSLVGDNGATADVNASKAFIASSYLNLEEVKPDGSLAQTIQLKNLIFSIDGQSFGTGGLRFVTFKGVKIIPDGFSVSITFVTSDVVGVLNVPGNPVITPRSAEIIIEIDNFPYNDVKNSVRLNIGTATGVGSVQASATGVVMSSGSGNDQCFFQLSNNAQVNGVIKPVSVSQFVSGTADAVLQNNDAVLQITSRYGAAASFQIVSVTFPAGASQILYDPAVGVGAVPQTGSAFLVAPSFLLLAIFAFFAMF